MNEIVKQKYDELTAQGKSVIVMPFPAPKTEVAEKKEKVDEIIALCPYCAAIMTYDPHCPGCEREIAPF